MIIIQNKILLSYPPYGYPPYPRYPYYPHRPYYSFHFGLDSRALLIELRSVDDDHTCLRCYPFSSSWEKRRILDELRGAASRHEFFPCVGQLGEYRVIHEYDYIYDCYERMHR